MIKKNKILDYQLGFNANKQKHISFGDRGSQSTISSTDKNIIPNVEKAETFYGFLFAYILYKIENLINTSRLIFYVSLNFSTEVKEYVVRNVFLGRGNLYRPIFQVSITLLTFLGVFTGLLNDLVINVKTDPIVYASGQDMFTEFGTSSAKDTRSEYRKDTETYIVNPGDTLSSIAAKYDVSVDTIKWANDIKSVNGISVGMELKIPPITGVVHAVKEGDSLQSIATKYNASTQAIADWNWLDPPNFNVYAGDSLIIPGGEIEEPVVVITRPVYAVSTPSYNPAPSYNPTVVGDGISSGNFGRITESWCGILTQGFHPWHQAIDIAQSGGCKLIAADGGIVTTAGWTAYGYEVYVDHGNGWGSRYGHGNGTYYVSVGQAVSKGQDLMYMGCTGICTGTHVHYELWYNGVRYNPLSYIPI